MMSDSPSPIERGTLYVVATPIGNLEDITLRALRILKESDLIVAEDTRHTHKLLTNYEITTNSISYRDQNHERVYSQILSMLSEGKNIALVSDAGTPVISDPGFKLVRDLNKDGYNVVAVPGASSVIASMSIAGLPSDRFCFIGFLPKGSGKRETILREYMSGDHTVILFESPYRLEKIIGIVSKIDPTRHISVAKDLTKMHEKLFSGTCEVVLTELGKKTKVKGEYVVLIAKEGFN